MSEDPKISEETPEKPDEAITDAELDDVAGGAAQKVGYTPIKEENTFVSHPPTFPKAMSFHESDAAGLKVAKRSVSELFGSLVGDPAADE